MKIIHRFFLVFLGSVVLLSGLLALLIGPLQHYVGIQQMPSDTFLYLLIASAAISSGAAFLNAGKIKKSGQGSRSHSPSLEEIEKRSGPLDRGGSDRPITAPGRHW